MRKSFFPAAIVLFAVVLMLLAHVGARLTMAAPTFTFAETREIYLTFDDGPSTVVTNRILDTLREEGVQATFFVVGDRVAGREETLRRIVAEGHAVGVHSDTHRYAEIYASDGALLQDAAACAEKIRRVTGVRPTVYRFPGGGHTDKRALLENKGYRVVWWNAVCGDEEIAGADADTLFRTAVETARGKQPVVLLMHDSAPHAETAAALPAIISHFKAEGYVFRRF